VRVVCSQPSPRVQWFRYPQRRLLGDLVPGRSPRLVDEFLAIDLTTVLREVDPDGGLDFAPGAPRGIRIDATLFDRSGVVAMFEYRG